MSDGYNYLDADGVYTDLKTGILHNLAKISDKDALLFFESAVVAKRLTELSEHPICVKDTTALFDIHRHLFQDVYKWAGERRTVEISKGNAAFFPTSRFDQGLAHIDGLIGAFAEIDRLGRVFKFQRIVCSVVFCPFCVSSPRRCAASTRLEAPKIA